MRIVKRYTALVHNFGEKSSKISAFEKIYIYSYLFS